MAGRIELQAGKSSDSTTVAALYDADLICYGIGRFSASPPSKLQLALLLALRTSLPLSSSSSLLLYDPLLSSLELTVLRTLGVTIIERNEECRRRVFRCSVLYMPHCGQALYNNLLWANWGWCPDSAGQTANSTDGEKRADERTAEEDVLSSALSSVHLTSASAAHLGHLILIGNQLTAYNDKRSFPPAATPAPPIRTATGRRTAQQPSYQSSRCPVHSAAPPTAAVTNDDTSSAATAAAEVYAGVRCGYECVCLVGALGLLRWRGLEEELRRGGEDMRLAFHDTAVQWFDRVSDSSQKRDRTKLWLQTQLAEPKPLANDGELVASTGNDDQIDAG